jgi:hypothetical protein
MRFDCAGGKDIRQASVQSDGQWQWKAAISPRPLYRLPQILASKSPVVLCEGEKAAVAASKILTGVEVSTWSGGAKAIKQTDFSILKGRHVTLWPDHDVPGRRAMETIAQWLRGVAISIRMFDPASLGDLPKGWDAADALAEKDSDLDALREAVTNAPVIALTDASLIEQEPVKSITTDDFFAYLPTHQYIFVPTRELWPASSVNSRITTPCLANGRSVKASDWLDQYQPVVQMVWAPGAPLLIRDRVVSNGGWIERPGCAALNLYREPQLGDGNQLEARRWIEHVHHIYGDEAEHIIRWLAHRVQCPGEKINHALVLGGAQGIGKDTLLEPAKYAVGPWNFAEVAPSHLLGRFNSFVKSVIMRVSEARDLGDLDRYAFYDHMKTYTAAPPDVLRCDEKNIREHDVMNVCGVIITSNHKSDGIYLPADDRRHFVAWSDLRKEDFSQSYWNDLWAWYKDGGLCHVAAHLATLDLSAFDPKAPPPKTTAFWHIVDANSAPEDAELADAIDTLGKPDALTLGTIAAHTTPQFRGWLQDRRNRRQIPHRLEAAGYVAVRSETASDGLWKLGGKRQAIYAMRSLTARDRIAAASSLCRSF